MKTRIDGRTASEWVKDLFAFTTCEECSGDAKHHDVIEVNGHWFARCHLPDTPMQHALTVWSERYGAQAATEGWSVFETSRGEAAEHALVDGRPYGHRPLELERDDEAALFADDMAVWTYVWQRASAMDACAFEALVLLKTYAPNEYAAIARHNTPQRVTA